MAGSSVLRSDLACDWVPNSEKPSVLHHMSKPPSATPMMVPNFDHSGLTLRTRCRSRPTAEWRQAFSYSASSSLARPAPSAAATCSAASMPLPAFEYSTDRGMGLEALKFIERRQIGIVVIEMHDEADRHLVVVVVIEERAAAGRIVQGPAERMLDQAFLVLGWIDLPDFLQPDAELRRLAVGIEREFRDQLLTEAAAGALG